MIKVLLFDLSWTLLFPKDTNYRGKLNDLHGQLSRGGDYSFVDHFYLHEETLDYLKSFKSKYRLCIFTSGTIQNTPEIRNKLDEVFEKIYSSVETGFGKKDSKAYKLIAKDLGVATSEILFIDDSEGNLKVAEEVGLETLLYQNPKMLQKTLRSYQIKCNE